jgi:hypothetical protein
LKQFKEDIFNTKIPIIKQSTSISNLWTKSKPPIILRTRTPHARL